MGTTQKLIVFNFLNLDFDVMDDNLMSTFQLTPRVEPGEIRFVLSWPYAPKDLDIHSIFKISRYSQCEIYFGARDCLGTSLDVDNLNGGNKGVETITIHTLGKYTYTFAVHKYVDVSNGSSASGDDAIDMMMMDEAPVTPPAQPASDIPDLPLSKSSATISVYTSEFKGPMYRVNVPSFLEENLLVPGSDDNSNTWWVALCLDGKQGISSLKTVNKLSSQKPQNNFCENFYRTG
jgi:hypothetical protein